MRMFTCRVMIHMPNDYSMKEMNRAFLAVERH